LQRFINFQPPWAFLSYRIIQDQIINYHVYSMHTVNTIMPETIKMREYIAQSLPISSVYRLQSF
jgi:hypothetical protein